MVAEFVQGQGQPPSTIVILVETGRHELIEQCRVVTA